MAQRRRKRKTTKRLARKSQPAPPLAAVEPAPDIEIGQGTAGRETLAAIAEELAPAELARMERVTPEPGPEIEIGHAAAGRETLAAISDELRSVAAHPSAPEDVRTTISYEDRPEEPGSGARARQLPQSPIPPPRPRLRTRGFSDPPPSTAPHRSYARTKSAAAAQPAGSPEAPRAEPTPEDLEVFEMVTFVVRGDLAHLSSARARRDFVTARLLHRLPVASIDHVDRIDVTPWTVRGTVVVRVWCRVPPA